MQRSSDRWRAAVTENIEKIILVENEALQARSRSEAIVDAIGSHDLLCCGATPNVRRLVTVNAGKISWIPSFGPFRYPLLSSVTSLEVVLLTASVPIKQNRFGIIT